AVLDCNVRAEIYFARHALIVNHLGFFTGSRQPSRTSGSFPSGLACNGLFGFVSVRNTTRGRRSPTRLQALAGAGVGGAVGGLTGALIGMGIPEYEAKRHEGRVKDGGILLSVHSDDSQWT